MKRAANPHGRLDLALLKVAERLVRTRVEPQVGFPLWDRGLAELAKVGIRSAGVPRRDLLAGEFGKAIEAAIAGQGGAQ